MDERVPTSAGLSSFNLLDERKFFTSLALDSGMTILDYGCGVGNYSVASSPYVGKNGKIFAVDPWEEGIETLEVRVAMARLENILARVCHEGKELPINDKTVDLCLMATVVHILVQEELIRDAMREIKRLLKPGGRIAVVEFYKKDGPPGPPLSWRLSTQELEGVFVESGFQASGTFEVGPHNYLSLFTSQERL